MTQVQDATTKKNVSQFNEDVRQTGSYAYTVERLSAHLANARISEGIAKSVDFTGKTVLDLGGGDGAYTLEFPSLGVKAVVGVDPAGVAIEAANAKARKLGLDATVKFEVGNIYALERYLASNRFDCIVLRGVLHHLPDPARAIAGLAAFRGTIVVLEPNGNNPVLKLIEKYSHYHIKHEERSFTPALIRSWLTSAGFRVRSSKVLNLVPFFCPDWMAKGLRFIEPIVERLPVVRNIACGQSIIVAQR
jgi:2-polyprenyl-3-methyl-5-hydroxy-6-metoxy-1,4-benzoquinol methylase